MCCLLRRRRMTPTTQTTNKPKTKKKGFAVVKRGRDKLSGEEVAIKVSARVKWHLVHQAVGGARCICRPPRAGLSRRQPCSAHWLCLSIKTPPPPPSSSPPTSHTNEKHTKTKPTTQKHNKKNKKGRRQVALRRRGQQPRARDSGLVQGRPPQLHQALRRVHHAAQGLHRHRVSDRRRAARPVSDCFF